MTRCLPWLIAAVALSAALLSLVGRYLGRPGDIESRFPVADGISVRAETIDLSQSMKLNLRYSLISDDGVELEMIVDDKRVWEAFAEPLGVEHSWYEHTVTCGLLDGEVVLHSDGTDGAFTEHRRVSNGALVKREARPNRPKPFAVRPTPSNEELQRRIDRFREQSEKQN